VPDGSVPRAGVGMSDDREPDTKPAANWWADRPSKRTEAEREEHWQHWWLEHGAPYQAAVTANGDEPWSTDINERRELFMRRYR